MTDAQALFLIIYSVMSMDSYLLQPYINTVTRIMGQDDQIEYDESTGTYTITTKKDRYKNKISQTKKY